MEEARIVTGCSVGEHRHRPSRWRRRTALEGGTRPGWRRTTWEGTPRPGRRQDAEMPTLRTQVPFHRRRAGISQGERLHKRTTSLSNMQRRREQGNKQQGSPRPSSRPRQQHSSEQSPEKRTQGCPQSKEKLAWKQRKTKEVAEVSKTSTSGAPIE